MFYYYTSLKLESFEAELINKNNKRDFFIWKISHKLYMCEKCKACDETKRRQDNSYPNFNLKYLSALLGLGSL